MKMFDKYDMIDKILEEYENELANESDLLADQDATALFFILVKLFGYLLKDDPDKTISKNGVKIRKIINYVIKKIGPSFLMVPQVFEDRNDLTGSNKYTKIEVPTSPTIWAANHAFKDDTLASILAIERNAYIIFGSLPQFYNTIDGLTAWLNGVIMTNRKVKNSKAASLEKAKKAVEYGADIMMFPEGVWNKTSEKLLLNFWPGIYKIAVENNMKVIPVVHYLKDCSETKTPDNVIHTVVDDPIDLTKMSEKNGLEYLREVMGTWYYLILEKYGKTTREEEMLGYSNSVKKWEHELNKRVETAARYDYQIETTADYIDFNQLELFNTWNDIANIKNINANNIHQVIYAKTKVKQIQESNFQNRF